MSRPQGAKNKPKSMQDLITQLEERAAEKGHAFSYSFTPVSDEDVENKLHKKSPSQLDLNQEIFEVDADDDEDDNDGGYECGVCNKSLDGELPVCPHCGSELNW